MKLTFILTIIITLLSVFSIHQFMELNSNKQQFENITTCLNEEEVTKDLIGAFINDEGLVECHYGIGNGMVQRTVLESAVLTGESK